MLFEKLSVLDDPAPQSAALNMALDEVLLGVVKMPTLRLYRWARPAVSFGYFGKYAQVAEAWPGREMVRRMTGGGIVPHGEDVTYSLIVPASHPFSQRAPRDTYRSIHDALAPLLGAALAPVPAGQGTGVCFENAEEFDLVDAGRKVAGAAQRRTRDGLLHQGSIQRARDLNSLRAKLPAALGRELTSYIPATDDLARAAALAESKYATAAWLRRV